MLVIAQIQKILDDINRLLGRVKISDGTNDAAIIAAANALQVGIVDSGGTQIESFGGSPIDGNPVYYTGTLSAGNTSDTLDFNNDLSRDAKDWYVINDGPGDITIEVSNDGITYATAITWKATDGPFSLYMQCDSVKVNYVSANAVYRAVAL